MASESQLVGTAHSPQPEHNSAGLEAWNGSFVFDQEIVSWTTFHNLPWIIILIHSACFNRRRISLTAGRGNSQCSLWWMCFSWNYHRLPSWRDWTEIAPNAWRRRVRAARCLDARRLFFQTASVQRRCDMPAIIASSWLHPTASLISLQDLFVLSMSL